MIEVRLSPQSFRQVGHVPALNQAAALCYRRKRGRAEILLITTRRSGNWIIPKGWLIDGLTACQSAGQEAWEEAGALGDCNNTVIGRFSYFKSGIEKGASLCVVDVFPFVVKTLASDFPECGQRQRKWFSPKKAAAKVNSPELAALLRKVDVFTH